MAWCSRRARRKEEGGSKGEAGSKGEGEGEGETRAVAAGGSGGRVGVGGASDGAEATRGIEFVGGGVEEAGNVVMPGRADGMVLAGNGRESRWEGGTRLVTASKSEVPGGESEVPAQWRGVPALNALKKLR